MMRLFFERQFALLTDMGSKFPLGMFFPGAGGSERAGLAFDG